MKKRLTEMYGLREGPFDDINRQLAGAQSVAHDPRSPQKGKFTRDTARMQADVDSGTSVVKREAVQDWDRMSVEELFHELVQLTEELPQSFRESALKLIMALQKKVDQEGGSSTRSTMATRSIGGVKLQ